MSEQKAKIRNRTPRPKIKSIFLVQFKRRKKSNQIEAIEITFLSREKITEKTINRAVRKELKSSKIRVVSVARLKEPIRVEEK